MVGNITIIIPVYGDWPSLDDCIESLKTYVASNHRVMLVNDCGPDADIIEKNIKKSIKGFDFFEYHRNPRNLGFLQNCNRAVFELDKTSNDIMLLNSDTKVTGGFLEEMQKVLYAEDRIATVSPRTNNATIATIPIISAKQKGINPEESYKLFNKIKNKLPMYNIAPVAHGFCMLIRRSIINEFGLFDEAFGKGYGEETDFCMRIAASGYKSAFSNRAYVFHLEARSFTMATKSKLLSVNDIIIDKRYPNYRRKVRDYTLKAIQQEEMVDRLLPVRLYITLLNKAKSAIRANRIALKILNKLRSQRNN